MVERLLRLRLLRVLVLVQLVVVLWGLLALGGGGQAVQRRLDRR